MVYRPYPILGPSNPRRVERSVDLDDQNIRRLCHSAPESHSEQAEDVVKEEEQMLVFPALVRLTREFGRYCGH